MAEIKSLAVLGGGQMGRGIAQVAAQAQLEVLLADLDLAMAQKAKDTIRASLEKRPACGHWSWWQR